DTGADKAAWWQVGPDVRRGGGLHRQVQVRADEELHVQASVDEEGVGVERAEQPLLSLGPVRDEKQAQATGPFGPPVHPEDSTLSRRTSEQSGRRERP